MNIRKVVLIAAGVAVCATAVAAAASEPRRKHINLPNKKAKYPFSDAVLVGDTLYLSGRIGLDPTTGKLPDDVDAEIRNLLDGFRAVLKKAGMSMDDLVTVQVFCPDVSLFERFNAEYRKEFKSELPARAFIGSGNLLFGARFEMQGVAVKGSRREAAKAEGE